MRVPLLSRIRTMPLWASALTLFGLAVSLLIALPLLAWLVHAALNRGATQPFDAMRTTSIAVALGVWFVTIDFAPAAIRRRARDPEDGLTRAVAGIVGGIAAVLATGLALEGMRRVWGESGPFIWTAIGPEGLAVLIVVGVIWGAVRQLWQE